MATIRPEVTGGNPRHRAGRQQAERLVYSVPEAGRLLGLGRNAAYEAARRGDLPVVRFGRLLRVPKTLLHRMLGMTGTVTATPSEITDAGAKLPPAGVKEE